MTDLDLSENIAALTIAIVRDDIFTVEDAFECMEKNMKRGRGIRRDWLETEELIALRNTGMSCGKVAEIFGLNRSAVSARIRTRIKEQELENPEQGERA